MPSNLWIAAAARLLDRCEPANGQFDHKANPAMACEFQGEGLDLEPRGVEVGLAQLSGFASVKPTTC